MRRLILLILFPFIVQIGHSMHPPKPHVRYILDNKTSLSVCKVIQIQSDTKDFTVIDTFAIDSNVGNEFVLYKEPSKNTRIYQKLIIFIEDTSYQTKYFQLVPEWVGYKVIINTNSITIEKTNHYKIRKVFSDILIALIMVFIIKGLAYFIGLFRYINKVYKELFVINFILAILLYISIDFWMISDQYLFTFIIIIIFSYIIGYLEYILVKRKLEDRLKFRLLVISLVSNSITVIIGIFFIMVIRTFAGIVINLP